MTFRNYLCLLLSTVYFFYVFGNENSRMATIFDATEDVGITFNFPNDTTMEATTEPMASHTETHHFSTSTFTIQYNQTTLLSSYRPGHTTEADTSSISTITTNNVPNETTTIDDVSNETTTTESVPIITTTTLPICDLRWLMNSLEDREQEMEDVTNLTATSVGNEWVQISWELPCLNVYNTSIVYSIKVFDDQKKILQQTNVTNTQANITGLHPCSQYTFNVKLVVEHRESNGANLTTSTGRNVTQVDDVNKLKVGTVNVDSIELTWEPSERHLKCVDEYRITQCLEDDCNDTVVMSTTYKATDLESCREYNFTVKVYIGIIPSSGSSITGRTSSPLPSQPQDAKAEPGNFLLNVHWIAPKYGAVCINHYRITINPRTVVIKTQDTNVTIHNLKACESYTLYITAVNEDNNDGVVAKITGVTAASVSEPPVLNSTVSVSKSSVSVRWMIYNENNQCPLKSVLTICMYSATNGHGYQPVNRESSVNLTSLSPNYPLYVNITVEGLSPFTIYTCWGIVANAEGNSNSSSTLQTETLEDVPSPPTLRVNSHVTDTYYTFTWGTPSVLPGTLQGFEIVFSWQPLFLMPDWCDRHPSPSFVVQFNASESKYDKFITTPFTVYAVRIRARTGAGWGHYGTSVTFQTRSEAPGPVTNLTYTIKESTADTNVLDTILKWGLPCSLNGELHLFNITVYGTRNGYAPHFFSVETNSIGNANRNDIHEINVQELKGEYNYTFAVSAKVLHVDSFGESAICPGVLYPSGIPPEPDKEYINAITIDPYKARRSTTSAAVLLPLFPDTNGNIRYYAIMVAEMGHNDALQTRFNLTSNQWPDTPSWEESMLKDFTVPYQATRPEWDPHPYNVADYGHMKAVKYVLGEDTQCKEISSNTDKRLYCNGPLKPDTWYHVRMRAFTYGGYNDSKAFLIRTNAELNIGVVLGVVFGILTLGILTTIMLLVRKCSPQIVLRRFLHSDMPGSPVPAPFNRKKFIAHCQQLVDNPGKLSNEFRLLQTLSVDLQMPANTACLQANRKKNRYSDILPYDFSRVKLEVIDNDPNTDYINASFIRGYAGEDEYIACQGPKEETTYDFWRMVDQYNVNTIVMLTQLVEKGKEKCHQYFPNIRETFSYENMTIRCTSELDFRTYTQRTLILEKEAKRRSIIHLHFKDWPDHDVPEDFDPMINFCQIVRRNIITNKGLVVVHCSAGIGRTGTLIAIDVLLQHLRDNRKLDVFGTVYRLRHHRINMVQRESQYAYIYNCIKQVLKNPYFLKTYKPPPVENVYGNVSNKENETPKSNPNRASNHEDFKSCNILQSVHSESMEEIPDFSPRAVRKVHLRTKSSGKLRNCKSTGILDVQESLLGKREFGKVIYKSMQHIMFQSEAESSSEDNCTQFQQ